MHRRNRLQYLAYPLFSFLLLTGIVSHGQDAANPATPGTAQQPPASTQEAPPATPPPDASQPATSQPDASQPAPSQPAASQPAPSQATPTQPATATPAPAAAPQTPDSQPQSTQLPPQTPEQRAKVLRDAQARVRARKEQRIAALIADTYNHKFEAYFGGGYLRFRPGNTLQHNTEADWNVGITDNIGVRLGITADFRGYYGTAYTGNNEFSVHNPSISQYTFMAGPQYRVLQAPKYAASVQLLAGIGHGNFDTGLGGLPGTLPGIGLYPNATVFDASIGIPFDYNLGPGLALRLTPAVLLSDYGSTLQYNMGFNANVVYRFGRKK